MPYGEENLGEYHYGFLEKEINDRIVVSNRPNNREKVRVRTKRLADILLTSRELMSYDSVHRDGLGWRVKGREKACGAVAILGQNHE